MLQISTPEQVGIPSAQVLRFLQSLHKRKLPMHTVLLMRGEQIFLDASWAPFDSQTPHRMYSVTKSFVSVAVGLALEDGLIDLDRPMWEYFPEKIDTPLPPELAAQTVRQMLTMTTAGLPGSWFTSGDPDRTHHYFHNRENCHPAGTVWKYDSHGSQVLCALVEKVTGKSLLDYLDQRIFRHLEAFTQARILKAPNGDSWGDSAMICTPRDLALFTAFVGRYGNWHGKQLMDAAYLKTATSPVVSNREANPFSLYNHGYGYQFWCTEKNGFVMKGMGGQLAFCIPDQELVMVCTADLQGDAWARDYILAQFLDLISDSVTDTPLAPDPAAQAELEALCKGLKLYAVKGGEDSPLRTKIHGKTYRCEANPLHWKGFTLYFDSQDAGRLVYEKDSGTLEIPFYVNQNRFGKFPELGYSKEYGAVRTTDGHTYKDAVSAAWIQPDKLMLYVQVIDDYYGNARITFSFKEGLCQVSSVRHAEDFLWDYQGLALGKRQG